MLTRFEILNLLMGATEEVFSTYLQLSNLPGIKDRVAVDLFWFAVSMKALRERGPDEFNLHCFQSGRFSALLEVLGLDDAQVCRAADRLIYAAINEEAVISTGQEDVDAVINAGIRAVREGTSKKDALKWEKEQSGQAAENA